MSASDKHDLHSDFPVEPDLPPAGKLLIWIGATVVVIVICVALLWRLLESETLAEYDRKTVKTGNPVVLNLNKGSATWLATGGHSLAYYQTAFAVMVEKKWLKGEKADRVKALGPLEQAAAMKRILADAPTFRNLVDREVKRRLQSVNRTPLQHVFDETLKNPSLLDPLPAPKPTTPTTPTTPTAPTGVKPTAPTGVKPTTPTTPTAPTGVKPTTPTTPTAPTGVKPTTPTAPTGVKPTTPTTPTAPTGVKPTTPTTPTGLKKTLEKKVAPTKETIEKKVAPTKDGVKKTLEKPKETLEKNVAPTKDALKKKIEPTKEKLEKKVNTTKDAGKKLQPLKDVTK